MRLSPFTKVLLIFFVLTIAVFVSIPRQLPLKFDLFGTNIDKTIYRNDIDISLGGLQVTRNLDLKLGLDLAGGSRLVYEVKTQDISDNDLPRALSSLKEVIERRVNLYGVSEPNIQTSSFENKRRIVVELPGVSNTNEAKQLIGQTAQLIFAEVGEEEEPGLFPTNLTGADLNRAEVAFDGNTGLPVVSIEFNDDGSEKFSQITSENIGKPLAIVLDGQVVSAPVVQNQIIGGKAQITGEFDTETANNLAIQLNAGALPLEIELVEEKTIGATLGSESVTKSVKAGFVGIAAVLIFMILIYGKLGFVADIALIVFAFYTLAIYKLIPVVLTLPGIAGFLLSVGMAVDSNILIFERFKEEKVRRKFSDALEVSFGRAWDSIRDANIATLLTAFILANPLDWQFLHTSGPVRGFALTLAIGILVSMFTGIVVSRNLLRVFIKESKK